MFIVFEGIDGSGKTTLSNKVAAALGRAACPCGTSAPTASTRRASPRRSASWGATPRNLALVPAGGAAALRRARRAADRGGRAARRCATGTSSSPIGFLYTAEVLARQRAPPAGGLRGPDPRRCRRWSGARSRRAVRRRSRAGARARRKAAKLAAADRRPPARKGLAGVGLQHRIATRLPGARRPRRRSAGSSSTTTRRSKRSSPPSPT